MSGKPCFHRNRNGDGRQAGKSELEALAEFVRLGKNRLAPQAHRNEN